jgi:glycosyltransferase involved in cell wall biosynthesis
MLPTVSICMIAKDESELLPGALESVKGFADEIIVVDTGSTDNTVEIAESYGAKVYHHPWENDFSLHRNQAFGYATGDWCGIIDCDERFTSDMSHFKSRLADIPPHICALVVRVHERGKGTSWLSIRFVRRSANPEYHEIVHNRLRYDGVCGATDIEMDHLGYSLDPEKMLLKRDRTEKLLLSRLEKDPRDHAALYYLCQMEVGRKNYDKAGQYGHRFFACVPVGPEHFQFYGVMFFFMSWVGLKTGDGEMAYAWARKGLEFYPDDIDLNYMMARIGYQAERDDWLEKYGKKYFELIEKGKQQPATAFETKLDPDYWTNKTIYCADDEAARNMKRLMGEALRA